MTTEEETWEQKEEPGDGGGGGGEGGEEDLVPGACEEGVARIEEEEEMMEEEEEEMPMPKVAPAPPNAPKKEHVNVVFIGHVGESKRNMHSSKEYYLSCNVQVIRFQPVGRFRFAVKRRGAHCDRFQTTWGYLLKSVTFSYIASSLKNTRRNNETFLYI